MEIFELRYFLAVAKEENIHRASEVAHVSSAALSKTIARLEEELGVNLFHREGRGIRLSEAGKTLQIRAADMVQREEGIRLELGGGPGSFRVTLGGPEMLLARFGMKIARQVRERYPQAVFDFTHVHEERVAKSVKEGNVWLGLGTLKPPEELASKVLERQVPFQTFVGKGHVLYRKRNRPVPVEEVLEHEFVSFPRLLVGNTGERLSPDGWRDDRFPRKIGFHVNRLYALTQLVMDGMALAYVPQYVGTSLGLQALEITGCPYSCHQQVYMMARDPSVAGWLKELF